MAIPNLKPPLAADAIEDGLHTAKRILKHRVHELEDLRDAAALKVRQAPFATVGVALGAGILVGLAMAWAGSRFANRERTTA